MKLDCSKIKIARLDQTLTRAPARRATFKQNTGAVMNKTTARH
jgi:hypothetical protein